MTMTVYKPKGRNTYTMDFILGGRRVKRSTRRTTRKEALAVEDQTRRQMLDAVQLGVAPRIRLKAAVNRWQSLYGSRLENSASTASIARTMFEGSAATAGVRRQWSWPDVYLDELTTSILRQAVNQRLSEGLAAWSIHHELGLVRRTIRRLTGEFRVPAGLEWPNSRFDRRLRPNAKSRWLTTEEIKALMRELRSVSVHDHIAELDVQDNVDIATLLLNTGARPAEIMGLMWQDIDLQNQTIHLHRPKVKRWTGLTMSKAVREVLIRRRGSIDHDVVWVFPSRRAAGHRTHARGITNAMDRAGLNTPELVARGGRATLYSLRDTYASRLAQTGAHTLQEIAHMLGHTTTRQTEKYAHLMPEKVSRAAAATVDQLNEDL